LALLVDAVEMGGPGEVVEPREADAEDLTREERRPERLARQNGVRHGSIRPKRDHPGGLLLFRARA
jgi:hypothetical protein